MRSASLCAALASSRCRRSALRWACRVARASVASAGGALLAPPPCRAPMREGERLLDLRLQSMHELKGMPAQARDEGADPYAYDLHSSALVRGG